jgi:hypothetical protein
MEIESTNQTKSFECNGSVETRIYLGTETETTSQTNSVETRIYLGTETESTNQIEAFEVNDSVVGHVQFGMNLLFFEGGLTDLSIEMTCEIFKQIISKERRRTELLYLRSLDSNEELNYEDEVNDNSCIDQLQILLINLNNGIGYKECELLKAHVLLSRFYKLNLGNSIFRNSVDLFLIMLMSLLTAHKVSNDIPVETCN